jgi:hypothetical protein
MWFMVFYKFLDLLYIIYIRTWGSFSQFINYLLTLYTLP